MIRVCSLLSWSGKVSVHQYPGFCGLNYTGLALFCDEVCKTPYEGPKGKRLDK